MPISLARNPQSGKRWTLREWVQGKPIGHPSHPMFVHFPVAFYLAVLVFDVMSRLNPDPGLVRAGTYLIVGALISTVILVITGLTDWTGMVPGSSKRRLATQHMVTQLTTTAFFLVALVLRWPERSAPQADVVWIVLEAIGYAVIMVGQYLGGVLVYERAMRVSTGGAAREPDERAERRSGTQPAT